ncbi:MAG: Holliday junction resolvase RuvX [Chloroflexi bacterium]|nr:Holliday junction resolvase RuvX [Chloroflexota bacterium]
MKPMRIMALDIGKVRSGVAVTDPTQTFAQPLTVLDSRDPARFKAEVLGLVKEYQVERVIVGIPLSLDGRRGPMAHLVEGVRRQLAASLPVPVEPWDERFSSVSADRALQDAGLSRAERERRQDAAAAAFVLQGYLDSLRLKRNSRGEPPAGSPSRP